MTKQDNYHKQELQFAHIIPMLDKSLVGSGYHAEYFRRGLIRKEGDLDILIFNNKNKRLKAHLEAWNWGKNGWGSTVRLRRYDSQRIALVKAGKFQLDDGFFKALIFMGGGRRQYCLDDHTRAGWRIFKCVDSLDANPSMHQLKWLRTIIERLVELVTSPSNVSYEESSMVPDGAFVMPASPPHSLLARFLAHFGYYRAQVPPHTHVHTPPSTHLSIHPVGAFETVCLQEAYYDV